MAGRKVSKAVRLASGQQLWRLNQLGRLVVLDAEGEPLSNADADAVLREDTEARGIIRYPRGGAAFPPRRWPVGSSPDVAEADHEAEC